MKFLFQPISPFRINQRFGENKICVSLDGANRLISCNGLNPPSGYKSIYGPGGHTGIDLRAWRGQPVYCAVGGTVVAIDTQPRTGLDVRILSEAYKDKYITIYEHLLGYQPKIGDKVETGQLIGWADNTGWSSGDHLHFELRMIVNGREKPVDPIPYMFDMFALDVVPFIRRLKELVARLADKVADVARK